MDIKKIEEVIKLVKANDVKKMINSVQDETKKDIRQLQKQIRK